MTLRERHLVGAGAAACAVCCAAPVLGILGLAGAGAGAAATAATFALAGTVFALVVGVAALAGLVLRRRAQQTAALAAGADCDTTGPGPVSIDLTAGPDRS